MDNKELLQQKIKDLPFTEDLKNLLTLNDINTLENLLDMEVHAWHKNLPGFTYHFQHEIVLYVQKNNLTEHLKEG